MLRATVMQFDDSWDRHLPLMEFAYNNSFYTSLGMSPLEALYGKACRTLFCWNEVGERAILGPELVDDATEKMEVTRRNLKVAQDRQKNYCGWSCKKPRLKCWRLCIPEMITLEMSDEV